MPILLNQITKSLITSLIVAPAFASFATGDSMKGKDKGKDAFDGSIERSLYYAYHGDSEKGIASHATMFCSMTGNIFSKLIEKDFATSEPVLCTDRATNQDVSRQTSVERVMLNLVKFLRLNDYILLDRNLSIAILRPTLQAAKKTPNATIQPRSLKNTFERDVSAVKKLIVVQNMFLDSNGDIPSGKNVDDLIAFIWTECWKQHCFVTCKKNTSKKKSKTSDVSDSDEDDDDTEGYDERQCRPESIEVSDVPSDFTVPALNLNGKWMPKGWAIFVAYVCRHTRCCDDLVHFYVGDGQWLDQSKAKSRKREREDRKATNVLDTKGNAKHPKLHADIDEHMTLEQTQVSIQLAQSQSKDNYARLSSKVIQRQMEVSTLQQQQKSLWEMMMVMYNNNVASMKTSEEWMEFESVRNDLREARRQYKVATEELETFESNDSFGKASQRLLSHIGVGGIVDNSDSIKGASTPIVEKPSSVRFGGPAAATPVSKLSHSAFPTGVCCAGELLCREPMMELRENHICKTCQGIVHMLCVGVPVRDPDDNVICMKCYASES
jgi:hypothetical protein